MVTMDGNFFTGYRKNVIAKDEVIKVISIPYTLEVIFVTLDTFSI